MTPFYQYSALPIGCHSIIILAFVIIFDNLIITEYDSVSEENTRFSYFFAERTNTTLSYMTMY